MQSADESFKELHKKTINGFVVSYFLRYDPDKWLQYLAAAITLKRISQKRK